MLGKVAILYSADKAGSRRVAACLRAAGNDVLRLASPGAAVELIQAEAVDIIFLDHDAAPGAAELLGAAAGRVPVVALSRASEASVLLDLVCERGVDNLLARRGGKDADRPGFDHTEIVVTAEKILRQDLFGLRKYVSGFGVELSAIEVRGAEDRETVVACVQEYLRNLGAGRELAATVSTVADELTTNAIYNAPVDAAGRPRYAARSRRDKIRLRPEEYVAVEFGSDGHTFGLAVTDRFGRLTREDLRQGLRRCLTATDPISQKAGGAGLGLYTVLSSCNQLVVNVAPGERTEVIALVAVDGRMREVRSSGHSLHVFIAPPVASAMDGAVPVGSVVLSESLRIDLLHAATDAGASGVVPARRRRLRSAAAAEDGLPRGTMLLGTGRDLGIDTAVGVLRGATRFERVVETILLVLVERYAGAVLWSVEEGRLQPWCGAGSITDWPQLAACRLGPADECLLVAASHLPTLRFERGAPAGLDRVIASLTTGGPSDVVLAMPVIFGGEVRYVVHAFQAAGRQGLDPAEAAVLQRELTAALERLGPLAS